MKDAPNAFYKHLFATLSEKGYKVDFISDKCLVYKAYPNSDYFIGIIHVDDILAAATSQSVINEFHECIQNVYGSIPSNPMTNYVAFHLHRDRQNKTIYVDMPDKIEKLRSKFPDIQWNKSYQTPSDTDFFQSNSETLEPDKKTFLSKLQSLRYIAYKYRFDIHKEIAFLSTHSQNPSISDTAKLNRVMIYLYRTKKLRLKIQPTSLQPSIYVDASYGSHTSAVGHTGIVICIGGSPIFTISSKQKIVTLSSTEAEADALKEAMMYGLWIIGLFLELPSFFPSNFFPMPIHQDNMSTIRISNGPNHFTRSKHQFIRYAFIQQQIALFNFKIVYCPTQDMIADILTKPLTGHLFHSLVSALNLV